MATRLGYNYIDFNYGNNSINGYSNGTTYRLGGNKFFPFINRLINGDFSVNQTASTGTATNNIAGTIRYPDRWRLTGSLAGKFSATPTADGPVITQTYLNSWAVGDNGFLWQYQPPPKTFKTCIELKSLASTSIGVNDSYTYSQYIEGHYIRDMDFGNSGAGAGSSSARVMILSFYAKASQTGNYNIRLTNHNFSRVWKYQYNISQANTWERKALVIPVDQSGTWNSTSGALGVFFSLGLGSNLLGGTQGQPTTGWTAESTHGINAGVQLVNTLNATLRLTGIQLEYVGIPASSTLIGPSDFDSRTFEQELKLCMRYYQKSWVYGTAPGTQTTTGMLIQGNDGSGSGTIQQYNHIRFPGGPMSGQPTIQPYSYGQPSTAGTGSYWNSTGSYVGDATAFTTAASQTSFMVYFQNTFAHSWEGYHWTADADY